MILENTILLGAACCSTLAFMTLFYCLVFLNAGVPDDDREFRDPLPALLSFIWPLVRIIAYHVCAQIPFRYMEKLEKKLQRNGVSYLMMSEEFVALKIFTSLLVLGLGVGGILVVDEWNTLFIPVFLLLGYLYPDIWMRDLRKRQVDGILRTLPAHLDFISMAVQAGLNFSGAIEQARIKGPKGPLVNEFGIVLRDLRSGTNREQALKRMADRLDITELTSFVNAVVQAEKMGSGLGSVLKIQAEQRRNERFQRAEKKAMEAPVKLVGPLILFIFPTTFIILAFPIIMKFLHGGLF
ncbi:MAG: type II secretion system F family protein [Proteobacteria bacterium]|nr:type II secretion system F family protein [Pseudomonadota bacterium]